jgi:hypothetical protein
MMHIRVGGRLQQPDADAGPLVDSQDEEAKNGHVDLLKTLPDEAQPVDGAKRGQHNYTLSKPGKVTRISVQSGPWCVLH